MKAVPEDQLAEELTEEQAPTDMLDHSENLRSLRTAAALDQDDYPAQGIGYKTIYFFYDLI